LLPDYFYDGVTAFDERFFNAQKDRQLLELSLVIPRLKKYGSLDGHSSKRTKIG
jgi:hypothetical protein